MIDGRPPSVGLLQKAGDGDFLRHAAAARAPS